MPTLFALLASRIALLEQEGLYRYKPELVLAGTGTVVPWYLRYRGTVGTYLRYRRYRRYRSRERNLLGLPTLDMYLPLS